ncbi:MULTISPECIES: hypothetical protein [Pseudomonas]|uniref:Phenylacetate-CoA ligase n=1 Tax=Pseudomonas cucumis TaxID=2954082 RepID=A0ABY9F3U8_9PSED|nr:hypothetical protein [Pseudomonas cucumis]WLG87399.1 hypothetical protein PSH97_13100 [Pseudomonas cucumis]
MSIEYFQVPLYQPLMKSLAFFFEAGDSADIPLLNKKEIISGFPENFMTSAMRLGIEGGDVEFASTSGSSSQILQIIRYKDWWGREFKRAYQCVADMVGYSMEHDKKAVLTTATCSSVSCFLDNPDYQQRIHNGVLSLNTHPDPTRWTLTDIQRIDAELRMFSPKLLEVDPTYLAIFLAKRAEYQIAEPLYIPDYLAASYEYMTTNVRRLIESAYGLPVLSMYGSTELGVLFMQDCSGTFARCGHDTLIELRPHLAQRNLFELIVTSWKNPLMPLLRYATGDLVEVAQGVCPNKVFGPRDDIPLLKLHGRIRDCIVGDGGEIKTLADLNELFAGSAPWARQYQLRITEHKVTLFYVVDAQDRDADMSMVERCLRDWLGRSRTVESMAVPSIAPEASGKFAIVK